MNEKTNSIWFEIHIEWNEIEKKDIKKSRNKHTHSQLVWKKTKKKIHFNSDKILKAKVDDYSSWNPCR